MKTVSFVIPCYKSADSIGLVVSEIDSTMDKIGLDTYEIILVNDCSPDNLIDVIREICENNHRVLGIDLAKNFGQHGALMAGAKHAQYETVVFLDDDGQTPACEVGNLIDALGEDCDIAFARYADKKHHWFRNLGSKFNDYMAEKLIGKPKDIKLSSYVVCKRFVIDEVIKYSGNYPYLSGLLLRSSNKIKNVATSHRERDIGTSGYTLKKLISLWLNGFTAFSVKPLRIATILGMVFAFFGFAFGIFVVIQRIVGSSYIPLGYASTMTALLLIGGMIMVILGLIGEYIGRIYMNINNAPQFVIREYIGKERS